MLRMVKMGGWLTSNLGLDGLAILGPLFGGDGVGDFTGGGLLKEGKKTQN